MSTLTCAIEMTVFDYECQVCDNFTTHLDGYRTKGAWKN